MTNPHTQATRRVPKRPLIRDLDEQTAIGAVYLRTLMRRQLLLGLRVIALVAVPLAALPLTFLLMPQATVWSLFGIPLPWLLLGGACYPAITAVAWWFVRLAERNEQDFDDLVHRR